MWVFFIKICAKYLYEYFSHMVVKRNDVEHKIQCQRVLKSEATEGGS